MVIHIFFITVISYFYHKKYLNCMYIRLTVTFYDQNTTLAASNKKDMCCHIFCSIYVSSRKTNRLCLPFNK